MHLQSTSIAGAVNKLSNFQTVTLEKLYYLFLKAELQDGDAEISQGRMTRRLSLLQKMMLRNAYNDRLTEKLSFSEAIFSRFSDYMGPIRGVINTTTHDCMRNALCLG